MRIYILFIGALLLSSCDIGHNTNIVVDNKLKGIQFVHYADSFDAWHGDYMIAVMLKNSGKKHYKYLELNASYLDETGKEVAQSIGGPEFELMPGDSEIVKTAWTFPDKEHLPYKVILSATN